MIRLFLFFSFSILLCSCHSSDKSNKYFENIDKELTKSVREDPNKIKKLYDRELKKYNESQNKIFLISSKLIQISNPSLLYREGDKIVKLYNLMQLNDNKYEYISIVCNYNLAMYFEITSPPIISIKQSK